MFAGANIFLVIVAFVLMGLAGYLILTASRR